MPSPPIINTRFKLNESNWKLLKKNDFESQFVSILVLETPGFMDKIAEIKKC
jgi:hypothetical protein